MISATSFATQSARGGELHLGKCHASLPRRISSALALPLLSSRSAVRKGPLMEAYLLDWANLLLRWLHVIVGIAWIGASFYFVWLDNHLVKTVRRR